VRYNASAAAGTAPARGDHGADRLEPFLRRFRPVGGGKQSAADLGACRRGFRFADQPALLNADLTDAERAALQKRVEMLHRKWTKDAGNGR
jgi:hypothetical protein